jgi:hypothetical protein
VLGFAVLASAIVLLPIQPVDFNQTNEASAANVSQLNMTIKADAANVYVSYRNLSGNQRAAVNVSATGSRGIFSSDQPVTLEFEERTIGSTLTYTVRISRTDSWFFTQNVLCYVYIDPSVALNLTVQTVAGQITFETRETLTIQNLSLETTTGNVEANLTPNVLVAGSLALRAVTGNVKLGWNGADVSENVPVTLRTTTGSAEANIIQSGHDLSGNVTLDVETTTGGIDFALDINGGVGAKIETIHTVIGGIDVEQQGFSADEAPLQSDNYPASGNFLVSLRATTGGIQVKANYESGVRS